MTGQAERAYAVQAVASGAYDFYQKPVDADVLILLVERAYGLWALEEEHRRLSSADVSEDIPGFITTDPDMVATLQDVRKAADSMVSVLILGESGTGKELVASAIHELGPRKNGAFVPINCAAIPDQLLESELFGHEKGAFTGAIKTTKGKIELADRGTLFLDEIGDLGLPLQAKLLRFLEDRVIERVGGRQRISVDVRVVSATNQDLPKLIEAGRFREDLFYRLGGFTISLSPLRARKQDSVGIGSAFLQVCARENGRAPLSFTEDAMAAISQHDWPGNVRELQNRIRRAVLTATGRKISAGDLGLNETEAQAAPAHESLKDARDRAERQSVLNALNLADGNISRAARILKISRPKLYDLIRYHDITI
jgi:two-component system NtrC family response regulator